MTMARAPTKKQTVVTLPLDLITPVDGPAFKRTLDTCTRCGLYDGCKQGVPGKGPVPADILFVGEAPGFNEDMRGLPFVGNAGRKFSECCNAAGIRRSDCYVSNTLKHRPPGNRTPKASEVKACLPYLLQEIAAVRPKLIVCLGGTAFKALAQCKESITRARGMPQQPSAAVAAIVPDVIVVGTYHPSFALRQGESISVTNAIIDDLTAAVGYLDNGLPTKRELPPHERRLVKPSPNLWELMDALRQMDAITDNEWAADCEWTKAEDRDIAWPWTPHAELFSLSFSGRAQPDGAVCSVGIAWPPPEGGIDVINRYLRGRKVAFHNGMADLIWLWETGLEITLADDTLILAYLLNEEQSLKLESLAGRYAGVPEWKTELWTERPATDEDWHALLTYNTNDTAATLLLLEALREELNRLPADERKAIRRLYRRLYLPATTVFVAIAHRGMPLYLPAVREAIGVQRAKLQDLCAQLAASITVHETIKKPRMFKSGKPVLVKGKQSYKMVSRTRPGTPDDALAVANSHIKIKKLFAELYQIQLPKTDKGVMSRLALEYPEADLIQQIKAARKLLSTYLQPWAELLQEQEDGRLHNVYSMTSTRTSRTTARTGKGGSLQLAPREPWFRAMFRAEPGRVIIPPDLSQVELRMIAWLAPEPTMRRVYNTAGADLHRLTAAFVKTGNPNPRPEDLAAVTDDERFSAKRTNFGYAYGMRPARFVEQAWNDYRVVLSMEEATRWRKAYFNLYPGLAAWHERVERVDFKRGYTLTPFGQKRRLLADVGQAINAPIQTTGTQLALLSMIEMERIFEEERPDLDTHLVGFVHDSIEIDAPDDPARLPEICAIIKEQMEHPPTWRLGVDSIPVPIVADVKPVKEWS